MQRVVTSILLLSAICWSHAYAQTSTPSASRSPEGSAASPAKPSADIPRRMIMATDQDSILQWLGSAAKVLPNTKFTLLGGNGLDRNIVIRQATVGGVQYSTIVNPAWWPVSASVRLDCPDSVLVVNGTESKDTLKIDLAPYQAAVVTVKPLATFLSAETSVPESVQKEIIEKLTDLTLILPHLATRRPNLLAGNGGFEKLDSRKLPCNWRIFEWHRKGSLFGFDTTNVYEGRQSFFMDNAQHGKTIGIASDRFCMEPGRGCEFAVYLGSSARPGKARIGFTGRKHLTKEVVPDHIWRRFSIALTPEQSEVMAASGWLRAEVHNDAKGILWVDDAKAVDSTIADLETSERIELESRRLADDFSQKDFVRCWLRLEDEAVRKLLERVAEMKKGREWIAVGPFPSGSDMDLAKAYPPEKDVFAVQAAGCAGLREKEYDGLNGIKADWVTWWADPDKCYVDLCAAVGPFDKSIAYACAEVHSDLNQKVKLLVGSDDGIAIWINGRLVHAKAVARTAKPAEDIVDADLKVGWNQVVVKVRNDSGSWGFYFDIADENGDAAPGLSYGQRLLAGR